MCICRAERRAERIDRIGKSRQHSLRTPIYDIHVRCYARLRRAVTGPVPVLLFIYSLLFLRL